MGVGVDFLLEVGFKLLRFELTPTAGTQEGGLAREAGLAAGAGDVTRMVMDLPTSRCRQRAR
jgi:hypothetical protein